MLTGARGAPLVPDFLSATARRLPGKTAMVAGGRAATYAEIEAASGALASALAGNGIVRGDRVVIAGENGIEVAVAFWGALKAGAVPVVIGHQPRPERMLRVVAHARAAALIADCRLAPHAAPVLSAPAAALRVAVFFGEAAPDLPRATAAVLSWDQALAAGTAGGPPSVARLDLDLAAIIYTSGSTGEPRGVMVTHRNMMATTLSVAAYLEVGEEDRILNLLPFSFSYGLYQMIMAFRAGATVVLSRSIAYAAEVVKDLAAHEATMFPGVPAYFAILAAMRSVRERGFPSVRCVTNAAAALPVRRHEDIRAIFPNARFFSMYGQTECKRVSYLPPADLARKPGSVGIPIPNSEFWVVDEDGNRLPPGGTGELVVRGPHVMLGYWDDPEATAARLRPGPLPGEKVLFTNDLCRIDEEGYLYFVARRDEVVKIGGEKVAPLEVELALAALPGVREAAVIGIPDEVMGSALAAFLLPEEGAAPDPAEVRRRVQERLEHFKVPRVIRIVKELPRTASGKVARSALRAPDEENEGPHAG